MTRLGLYVDTFLFFAIYWNVDDKYYHECIIYLQHQNMFLCSFVLSALRNLEIYSYQKNFF